MKSHVQSALVPIANVTISNVGRPCLYHKAMSGKSFTTIVNSFSRVEEEGGQPLVSGVTLLYSPLAVSIAQLISESFDHSQPSILN